MKKNCIINLIINKYCVNTVQSIQNKNSMVFHMITKIIQHNKIFSPSKITHPSSLLQFIRVLFHLKQQQKTTHSCIYINRFPFVIFLILFSKVQYTNTNTRIKHILYHFSHHIYHKHNGSHEILESKIKKSTNQQRHTHY